MKFGVWLALSPWGPAGAGAGGLGPCVSDSLGLAGQLFPLGLVKSSFLQKQEVLCPGCKQTHLGLQSLPGEGSWGEGEPLPGSALISP